MGFKTVSAGGSIGRIALPLALAVPAWAADVPAPGEVNIISVKESMSPANSAFQACVTGLPAGQTVAVGVDKSISRTGMVKFDGQAADGSLLIEAKGFGYKIDEKLGVWKEGYVSERMQRKLLRQADRQMQAAKSVGRAIRWVVPNAGIQRAFQQLLSGRIPVEVAVPKPECPKSGGSQGSGTDGSF